MPANRREFLRTSAAAGAAIIVGADRAAALPGSKVQAARGAPPRRIRLLILGGTGFIGPHEVSYALERGHEVTIFNRGRRAPGMFSEVEELIGDRAVADYSALEGREWDAVIDNSASAGPTAPKWVNEAATALKGRVGQYLFISTRSVFADLSTVPATVNSPVLTPETTPGWSAGQPYPYGLGKALAEQEARNIFGEANTTIVRPGLIVGPGDETDRFTYWPVRIERGGEIIAPGEPNVDRIQIIDVRDLCDWAVRLCEQGTTGTFMGVGPLNGRSISELLYGIAAVVTTPLSWTWIDREFLMARQVRPYSEMPVWMPPTPGREGFARFDLSREVAAGLTFRSLADTATATLEYHHSRPAERQASLRSGLSAEREAEVLREWHAQHG